MKRIVLFSPTGYVGSLLKDYILKEKDIQLLEVTRNSKLEEYYGDYDILIYSASISLADTEKYISDNVLTAIVMMKFCKVHHIKRIIYLSSDSIYGDLNVDEVSENVIMVNPGMYGITKYMAERIIFECGIPYYILRLPGIVGRVWRNTYLYRLIDKFYKNECVQVYNSDKKFNNVLDIDDLINFILQLCSRSDSDNEIFLLGNTEKIELIKIVNYIKEITQSTSEIVLTNVGSKRYFTLNVNKAIECGYVSKPIWDIIDDLYMIKQK